MKKYNLTSIGFVLLNVILSVGILTISIIITFYADSFNLIACIFLWLVFLGLLFGLYLCFKHKVIIYDEFLIIQILTTYKIIFDDIQEVKMEDDYRTIYIITKDKHYQFPGYFVLFNNKKSLRLTRELIEEIKKVLIRVAS